MIVTITPLIKHHTTVWSPQVKEATARCDKMTTSHKSKRGRKRDGGIGGVIVIVIFLLFIIFIVIFFLSSSSSSSSLLHHHHHHLKFFFLVSFYFLLPFFFLFLLPHHQYQNLFLIFILFLFLINTNNLLFQGLADTYIKISTCLNQLATVEGGEVEKMLTKVADCLEKVRKIEGRVAADEDLKLSDTLRLVSLLSATLISRDMFLGLQTALHQSIGTFNFPPPRYTHLHPTPL